MAERELSDGTQRQAYLAHVCEAIAGYVRASGPIQMEATHGPAAADNHVTFTIGDWEAFRAFLEPGTDSDQFSS